MDLTAAYDEIWGRKLKDQQPPAKQSIPRVNQMFDLVTEHHARVNRMSGPLLDVGCGSGAMLAKAQGGGFTPFGVDFNGPLLEWLRGHGYTVSGCDLNVDRLPDVSDLPIEVSRTVEPPRRPIPPKGPPIAPISPPRRPRTSDALADAYRVVTCADVIEHLIDPDHMLAEVYRVLAPGGHAYVSTPNAAYWQRVQQLAGGEMFRTSGDNVLRDGGHLSYWAEKDLGAALKRAGFREVGFRYHDGTRAPASLRRGPWSDGAHMLAWAVK